LIACYNRILVTCDKFYDPNARNGYNQQDKPRFLRYFNYIFASHFINHLGRKAAQIQRYAGCLNATQKTGKQPGPHSLMLLTVAALCAQTRLSPPVTCTNACLSARYLHKRMSLRPLLPQTDVSPSVKPYAYYHHFYFKNPHINSL